MFIVRVDRRRGDSRYVKNGIKRSSGGSIRLRQAEIQEHTRKGELYVLEAREGTVEGCLLISIDGTNLLINIISLSQCYNTRSVCSLIVEYAKSLAPQAQDIAVLVPRRNYTLAILLRDRGLVVVSLMPDWIALRGILPLGERNTHVCAIPPGQITHPRRQRSLWLPRGLQPVLPFARRRIAPVPQEPPGPLQLGQDSLHLFQTPAHPQ